MNKEIFCKELEKLGIKIQEEQLKALDIYCNYLLEVNMYTNLTAIKEEDQVYLKHFYDSLTLVKAIDLKKENNLIDIGTGAGFPGLILKIIFPNLEVTLLDSNNKKINFLSKLIKKLEIKGVHLVHGRAEEFVKDHRETFDLVTGRAVSNMSLLSELCLPLVKKEGYFIALKGANEEEIEDAQKAIQILGGEIENRIKFKLPIEESERNIIKIKKVKRTPDIYPRRFEKIRKSPLK